MSMINDALRRARSASKGAGAAPPVLPPAAVAPPPPPPLPGAEAFPPPPPPPLGVAESLPPALTPDGEGAPPGKSNKVQLILAMLLVLAVGIAAAVTFWEKKHVNARVDVSANEGRKAILPDATAIRAAEAAVTAITNRAAVATAPTTAVPAAPGTPAPPVAAAPPQPPPKFPPLRLQSIFYRPTNPSVMINGKTLYLGDEIQGVTVADIQPASVTLVLSGHTNILTLR
jgi:hypothetical protein